MNREQRRKVSKNLRKSGASDSQIIYLLGMREAYEDSLHLEEGDKVQLNTVEIKASVDWPRMRKEYRDYVEAHQNEVFTVEYDKKFLDKPQIVALKEDTTVPKWLWWEGYLKKVKQDKIGEEKQDESISS